MTIEEIRASDKTVLIPRDVCGVLGCSQYSINVTARQAPEKLGFPVAVIGTRVKIPRTGFLNWWDGTKEMTT